MTKNLANDYSDSKHNYNQKESKVTETVRDAAKQLSESNIQEILSRVLEDFGKFLEEKKDDITEKASECTGKVRGKIKDHPLLAIAGAAAIGAIIGALLRK
ncbi:MAG: hypothetical protein K0R25_1271 [Rickettsiaceae bacterium]|jgi:ElaB/YqjD/DUF883 family membrane-anchored ribosome-binding protein|nr:hypothetical protein [Rickettsiaceae bacterium]